MGSHSAGIEYNVDGTTFFQGRTDAYPLVFRTNSTERARITSGGAVSVGNNTSPDGKLHVYSSSAGTVTADADADELVLESSGNTGLSILSPGSGESSIYFGNPGTNGQKDGWIKYYHETHATTANRRALAFRTSGTERLRINSSGFVGINSTTPRTYLQVSKGSSHYNPGNPTAFNSNNVLACFENNDDVEVTFLSPNNKKNIINFGDTDNVANSSIEYDHSINHLIFKVNGGSERLRINNSGAFGLAGQNYGTSGQVLKSGGTNGVPTWGNAGITMADQWRITSSSTLPGSVSILNSNWGRVASPSGYGNLGSAMSESSGAFTFPATGIYYVEFTILISMTQAARYVGNRIQTSTDNFSSANTVAETLGHMALANSFGAYHTSTSSFIFDVTNTSTHKVRFCGVSINPSASSVIGNANQNSTFVTFIRLGDT